MALVGNISGSLQSNSKIGISGSVIIADRPDATFPALPGTDVKFYVEGLGLFGSQGMVSSGSLAVKDSSGVNKFTVASASGNTSVGGTLAATGVANLNGGLYVAGATGLSSSLDLAGNFAINTDKFTVVAATGNISGSGTAAFGATAVNGSLTVTATGGTGNGTFAGDVAVNGGDLTTTNSTASLFNANALALSIGSSATAVTVGSAAGTGTTTVNNSLIVTKDLTVNGTMTTVNTTNLEIKDSVIGLGFASGTIQQAVGDRGWIGGLAGTNNVMSKWDNAASEFAFATTTSSATGSFAITAYSNLHANNIQGSIVSASLGFSGSLTKLMDGTSYIIAGSGITVTSASNGAITLSSAGAGGDVTGPGSSTANAVALFDGTTGKIIKNSGLTTDGSNSLFIAGTLGVSGSTTFGASALPSADMTYNLGSPSFRWANVYTGDLHLRNDRGDYTLIEEEDCLTIRFNKTGKRYKFLLEAVPQLDEDPTLKF